MNGRRIDDYEKSSSLKVAQENLTLILIQKQDQLESSFKTMYIEFMKYNQTIQQSLSDIREDNAKIRAKIEELEDLEKEIAIVRGKLENTTCVARNNQQIIEDFVTRANERQETFLILKRQLYQSFSTALIGVLLGLLLVGSVSIISHGSGSKIMMEIIKGITK